MRTQIAIILFASLLVAGDSGARAVTSATIEPPDEPIPAQRGKAVANPAPRASLAADSVPSGNPLWAIPLRQLTATRERPLFTPSRRPPPPVVANQYHAPPLPLPPKPAEPEKPPLALVGTVARGTAERIGIFFDSAARSVVRLKTGEDHKGWVLRRVHRREVILEKGQQSAVLALPSPEIGKAGPIPVPTASPLRADRSPPGPASPEYRGGNPAQQPTGSTAGGPMAGAAPAGVRPGMQVQPPQFKPAAAPVNPFQQQPIQRLPPVQLPGGRS